MKIIVEIDDEYYEIINHAVKVKHSNFKPFKIIANGTPLPKGHGRIIDESKITSVYYHEETAKQGAITAKAIFIDGTDAPTIIEADKRLLNSDWEEMGGAEDEDRKSL